MPVNTVSENSIGSRLRAVLARIGQAWREVAMAGGRVRVLRQNLAETREMQSEFHDALAARLLQLEAHPPEQSARWLADWDAVARAPMTHQGRLQALRVLFLKLAGAAGPRTASPAALTIELAPGEVLDRMTILEIKLTHITDEAKLRNVRHEHALLQKVERSALPASDKLAALRAELKAVNQAIWDIEDRIRDLERARDFGPVFVETARSVYKTNDRRAAVKRQINDYLGSAIVEEKSYAPY